MLTKCLTVSDVFKAMLGLEDGVVAVMVTSARGTFKFHREPPPGLLGGVRPFSWAIDYSGQCVDVVTASFMDLLSLLSNQSKVRVLGCIFATQENVAEVERDIACYLLDQANRLMSQTPDTIGKVPEPPKAIKHSQNKIRHDLVPVPLIDAAARAYTFGAGKYSSHNWCTGEGLPIQDLYRATLSHLLSFGAGELVDPESNLSHLDHAAAALGMLIATHNRELHRCQPVREKL